MGPIENKWKDDKVNTGTVLEIKVRDFQIIEKSKTQRVDDYKIHTQSKKIQTG